VEKLNSENLKWCVEIIRGNRFNEVNKWADLYPFEFERIHLKELVKIISHLSLLQSIKRVITVISEFIIIHFENFIKNEDILIYRIDVTVIEDFRSISKGKMYQER
jgi:hypothetical protein